ncbi:MAG: CcoQ/FixQ family Cbb3-type cytochrome c oxidase assembly chaperone [Alphaproteobacteria bacterium]|nr:CcoQ/FixQ family Cbb3-type cytochrome c oxidase assembly chaperone [Alphaproteobacteria bacterium]
MDYHQLRHLADSWGLVYLTVIFVGVVAFLFRPGAKKTYDRAARMPLDED